MNALLKKYRSSKSEMPDFIEFLKGFEKVHFERNQQSQRNT